MEWYNILSIVLGSVGGIGGITTAIIAIIISVLFFFILKTSLSSTLYNKKTENATVN